MAAASDVVAPGSSVAAFKAWVSAAEAGVLVMLLVDCGEVVLEDSDMSESVGCDSLRRIRRIEGRV